MPRLSTLTPVVLLLAGTGCTHLGTNISGQFTCRAPKGDCAPSRVIDGRVTAALAPEAGSTTMPDGGLARTRARASVIPGDATRTGERTLRVIFPAHVDDAGVLHDEAVAWAVVEAPQWSGALRAASTPVDTSLIRTLRRRPRDAKPDDAAAGSGAIDAPSEVPGDVPNDVPDDQPPLTSFTPPHASSPIASPTVLPSTAAEASAGGPVPPVAEGSDMPAPRHDRAPRPNDMVECAPRPSVIFPTAQAIDAAKARTAPASAPTTSEEHR